MKQFTKFTTTLLINVNKTLNLTKHSMSILERQGIIKRRYFCEFRATQK